MAHSLSSADISIFSTEISNFCYIKKYIYIAFWYIISNTFNMVAILMMSAKFATIGLFKITVFWIKDYDITIPVYQVTSKILSRDSNYVVDIVKWPKFGVCSIYMRKVIIT